VQQFAAYQSVKIRVIMTSNFGEDKMHANEKFTRRDVLKNVVAGAVAAGIAGFVGRTGFLPTEAKAAEALKLIDEQKDFSAKALGFHHDGGKTKRTDPKERCGTCKQFKKAGVVDGVDVGKCSLLAKGLVKSTGWCRSYLKDEALYKKA
jgi:hypothetical protein